jgi:peptidoglycan biosynthesis protein MviN/MurJ (putative lipid II flippase)
MHVARAIIASSSVNVVANLAFIPLFGVQAAAIITVVTEAVLVCQYVWLLRDMLGQMRWGELLRALAAVSIMAVLVYLTRDLPVILTVTLGAALYGGLLLGLRIIGRDEAVFLRGLLAARRAPAESQQGAA